MLAILFDLDGTLIDSAPGIIGSYQHAMRIFGVEPLAAQDMRWVVGPPARNTMPKLIGADQDIEQAVQVYRRYYVEQRLFDAVVYAGIAEALAELTAMPARLFVCTAKPIGFAVRLIDHFGMKDRFEAVYGSDLEGRFDDKGLLIEHIVAAQRLDLKRTIMVGDRANDMRAAARHAIPAVGALWGYGDAEELTGTGATILCASPHELAGTVHSLVQAM